MPIKRLTPYHPVLHPEQISKLSLRHSTPANLSLTSLDLSTMPFKTIKSILAKNCRKRTQKSLQFHFSNFEEDSEEGQHLAFFKKLFPVLKKFKRISFDLRYNYDIDDKTLQLISRSLHSLSFCKDLRFNLAGCAEISETGINHLTLGFRKCYSLDTIVLDLQEL
jgi:hypothetical protein